MRKYPFLTALIWIYRGMAILGLFFLLVDMVLFWEDIVIGAMVAFAVFCFGLMTAAEMIKIAVDVAGDISVNTEITLRQERARLDSLEGERELKPRRPRTAAHARLKEIRGNE